MPTYRIGLIEDNQQIRKALSDFLELQPELELAIVAVSYEDFTEAWGGRGLDLVLCDIGLPGKSGIDAAWYIKNHSEKTQVMMLTVFEDKENIFSALCAGASGYMLKSAPLLDIRQGIRDILNGGAAMSPRIAKQIAEFFYRKPAMAKAEDELTAREAEIVSLIRQGLSNREVAERLFITQDTVKYHIKNVYQKLQVGSRSELILRYQDRG
jgi:DNA-binding NarL/FixJ family response regulator